MPTTVFWPLDVKQSGFCYGWTTPAICVIGVLPVESEQEAKLALQNLRDSCQWKSLAALCGSHDPVPIGRCEFNARKTGKGPSLPDLKLLTPVDYHIIYYTRHESRTLRFYSLEVLKLDLSDKVVTMDGSAYLQSVQHDFTAPRRHHDTSSLNDTTIHRFNAAKTLDNIHQLNHPADLLFRLKSQFCSDCSETLILAFHFFTALCKISLLPSLAVPVLKEVSVTIQQIDIRAEQMDFLADEIRTLRQRNSTPIQLYSARYTNFFNAVWLILNDMIMGIALGTFICENRLELSQMLIGIMEGFLISWVRWTLRWLDSWPAGLKLNTELSRFYSRSFIGVVAAWGDFLSRGEDYLPVILYAIGSLSCCGGISFAVSLVLDMLAFSTLHIFICYAISGVAYQKVLRTFRSLWNLFRGKRYNVLRNRTDSWEYDLDQLLFGTILFTLLAFLFPTVLVYYALFAVMRLCLLVIQASLETLLALVNHFPLFALMLRVKDPWRLPGGVYFVRANVRGSKYTSLEIKNRPVPLSSIFFQYIQLLSRLGAHYNPLRLLRCVLYGDYLAPIPRYSIRYNKISNCDPGGEPVRNSLEQ